MKRRRDETEQASPSTQEEECLSSGGFSAAPAAHAGSTSGSVRQAGPGRGGRWVGGVFRATEDVFTSSYLCVGSRSRKVPFSRGQSHRQSLLTEENTCVS